MDIWVALSRAKRGFRDDVQLHLVAIASLVVAFLCLYTALLGVENLSRIAQRWGQSQHLTVYLRDGAKEGDVGQLRLVLESLPEIRKVQHISAATAREQFVEQTQMKQALSDLPLEAFPASLEIDLRTDAAPARVDRMIARLKGFGSVEEIESYRAYLGPFRSLLEAGRSGALLLALLVVVCVVAVIGNTIRLAIASRRTEIEVLKLCGATDAFVRRPFVIEGTLQATLAASIALAILLGAFLLTHGQIEATLGMLTGMRAEFLSPWTALGTIAGAGAVGALGSALSLRRHLAV